jgi:hypothetical protein
MHEKSEDVLERLVKIEARLETHGTQIKAARRDQTKLRNALYDAIKAGLVTTSQEFDASRPEYRGTYSGGWGDRDREFLKKQWSTCTYGIGDLGFHPRVYVCNASCEQMQNLLADSIKSYSTATAAAATTYSLPEST